MMKTILLEDPNGNVVEAPVERLHTIEESIKPGYQEVRLVGDKTLYQAEVAEVEKLFDPAPVTLPAKRDWLAVFESGGRLVVAPILAWHVNEVGRPCPITSCWRAGDPLGIVDPDDNFWTGDAERPLKSCAWLRQWWSRKFAAHGVDQAMLREMFARANAREAGWTTKQMAGREPANETTGGMKQ